MFALDIKTHPVFNLDQQLALFDGSKGQSKAATWMADIAVFFAGVATPAELARVKDDSYATARFLKLVKKSIPAYKELSLTPAGPASSKKGRAGLFFLRINPIFKPREKNSNSLSAQTSLSPPYLFPLLISSDSM